MSIEQYNGSGTMTLVALKTDHPPEHEATNADRNETLPSPITAAEGIERWNYPRHNIYKISTVFWQFVVAGLNDASYGAIIPYLQTYYGLGYRIVSLIFLSPFAGYVMSSLVNNTIHHRLGRRGPACLGPGCQLVAYIIIATHPPFPVLVLAFLLAGFGNGVEEAAWNAWIGVMAHANETLGLLHAFYGAGATVAPLVATALITKAGLPWYAWYYCMIGFAGLALATSLHAFRHDSAAKFRDAHVRTSDQVGSRLREAALSAPAARTTWVAGFFLMGYVGIEVALGGWIVEFMIRVRDAGHFASGMSATGFWLGITVGRVVLGFLTPRIGEKRSILVGACGGHVEKKSDGLTEDFPTDLHSPRHRSGVDFLARAAILRFRRRRGVAGLLPRALFSRRRGRLHQTSAQAPARLRYRVRGGDRREWRGLASVGCRCDRAGERCAGVAAYCPCAHGCHLDFVDVIASIGQEEGVMWLRFECDYVSRYIMPYRYVSVIRSLTLKRCVLPASIHTREFMRMT
jgi:MFS family permease